MKRLSFFIPQIKSRSVFQAIWDLACEIVVVQVSAIGQRKCIMRAYNLRG
jgi:hypothetical protein